MKRIMAITATLAVAGAANATIIFMPGPGNIFGDENVLYNGEGLIRSGLLVQGRTNQTSLFVNFFDAGEDLHTPASGQARVEAVDGDFDMLSIGMDDPSLTFLTLMFNLNATADGDVTFTVERTGGAPVSEVFSLRGNGQNFFRILAIDGDQMTKFSLDSTVQISDIKQVRISPIPEPATLTALAAGLGLFFARRRRR